MLFGAKLISEQIEFTSIFEFCRRQSIFIGTTLSESATFFGDYLTCLYDHDWYIGRVEEIHADESDLNISFMHPKESGLNCPKDIFCSARDDSCFISQGHILCKISAPTRITNRKYI